MLQYIFQHQVEIIFFPTEWQPSRTQHFLSRGKKSSSVVLPKLVLSFGLSISVEGFEESSCAQLEIQGMTGYISRGTDLAFYFPCTPGTSNWCLLSPTIWSLCHLPSTSFVQHSLPWGWRFLQAPAECDKIKITSFEQKETTKKRGKCFCSSRYSCSTRIYAKLIDRSKERIKNVAVDLRLVLVDNIEDISNFEHTKH